MSWRLSWSIRSRPRFASIRASRTCSRTFSTRSTWASLHPSNGTGRAGSYSRTTFSAERSPSSADRRTPKSAQARSTLIPSKSATRPVFEAWARSCDSGLRSVDVADESSARSVGLNMRATKVARISRTWLLDRDFALPVRLSFISSSPAATWGSHPGSCEWRSLPNRSGHGNPPLASRI